MAQFIGTRTKEEVKLHAHKYFLKLQGAELSESGAVVAVGDGGGAGAGAGATVTWSAYENAIFESSIAELDDGCDRWEIVAQFLEEKSAADVRRHYQRLLYDIARIEAGEDVKMDYATGGLLPSGAIHGSSSSSSSSSSSTSSSGKKGSRGKGGKGKRWVV